MSGGLQHVCRLLDRNCVDTGGHGDMIMRKNKAAKRGLLTEVGKKFRFKFFSMWCEDISSKEIVVGRGRELDSSARMKSDDKQIGAITWTLLLLWK